MTVAVAPLPDTLITSWSLLFHNTGALAMGEPVASVTVTLKLADSPTVSEKLVGANTIDPGTMSGSTGSGSSQPGMRARTIIASVVRARLGSDAVMWYCHEQGIST